jgi:hypothetical protein
MCLLIFRKNCIRKGYSTTYPTTEVHCERRNANNIAIAVCRQRYKYVAIFFADAVLAYELVNPAVISGSGSVCFASDRELWAEMVKETHYQIILFASLNKACLWASAITLFSSHARSGPASSLFKVTSCRNSARSSTATVRERCRGLQRCTPLPDGRGTGPDDWPKQREVQYRDRQGAVQWALASHT